jgi:hypothetical protein
MTRDELIGRMSSQELSHWFALFVVHGQEHEHAQHVADSGDGIVYVSGKDDEPDDDGSPE